MRVEAGADCCPSERDLAHAPERRLDPSDALAHLGRVAAELLAERDRHGVHQVRPAGLDDVVELGGLRLERVGEPFERGDEVVGQLVERGQVDGRREHVVRGLPHVDVVVGVDAVAGDRGDHLVGVHVRRRAGAGLEDVDRELVVELAVRDPVAGCGDAVGLVLVEEAQIGVGPGGCGLDPAEPARNVARDRLAGHLEVLDRLLGLHAPELLGHVFESNPAQNRHRHVRCCELGSQWGGGRARLNEAGRGAVAGDRAGARARPSANVPSDHVLRPSRRSRSAGTHRS
jgi:hypothetical protein